MTQETRRCAHTCRAECAHAPCQSTFRAERDASTTESMYCHSCRSLAWMRTCIDCSFSSGQKTRFTLDAADDHAREYPDHELNPSRLVHP